VNATEVFIEFIGGRVCIFLDYVIIFVLNVVRDGVRFKTCKFMHTCPYYFRIVDVRVYGIIEKFMFRPEIKDFTLFLQML